MMLFYKGTLVMSILLIFAMGLAMGLLVGWSANRDYTVLEIYASEFAHIAFVSELIMERHHYGIRRSDAVYKSFLLYHNAVEEGLCPSLLSAVALVESDFTHHTSRNNMGAIGIMQLTPVVEEKYGIDGLVLEDNIKYGAKFLAHQLERYGSVEKALDHYVGGSERYVKEVIGIWNGLLSKHL